MPSVRLCAIDKTGLSDDRAIDVERGGVTLSLKPGQAAAILPADAAP